ncbi:MAG: response regulator [Verrucomicrobiota bacterium]
MGSSPGFEGVATAIELWKIDPDVQIVFCTASSDPSCLRTISRLGHADRLLILKKPLDTDEVVQIANALTAKWSLLLTTRRNEEALIEGISKRTRELEAEIAERRRSEEALRFTQFSVDHASDAMFRVAPDSRLTYVNATTCRSLGYLPEELCEMSLPDIVPVIREMGWDKFWDSLQRESRQTLDTIFLTRDGRQIPVELTVSFFEFGGKKSLCASARDITRRHEILAELAAARDQAMESARLKGQFLANMSHEIRTPMNGVIGMSELLVHTNLDREQREYVDTIRSSADLLLGIINDILDSSKIESGTMTFQSKDLDLREIVEHALDVVAPAARAKKLELAGCVQPGVHPFLTGDANRLKQVLTNMLGNAVKFTEHGEVSLIVSHHGNTPAADLVRFEIRDTGVGMDPSSLVRIFEPFHQTDGSNTRKYGGTGLGLTICKQIVEAMGGRIGVESHPGTGSTFWFTLAFARLEKPIKRLSRTIPDVPVLVVDDNATNRGILQLQLSNLQLRSVAATNGSEALEILRRAAANGEPFALAILDMQMPEMDGLTLARAIKADSAISPTRLIILSSLGDLVSPEQLIEAGVEEYVVKPVKMSRLESSLTSMFSGLSPEDVDAVLNHGGDRAPASEALILVAEDNFVNQKVDLLQLKSLGYRADLAADGVEALAALEQVPYDLIFMDCQMPGMDGYEATRRIREKHTRPIRIIALTANAMMGDREKCLDAGMDDHLSKPVRIDELKRMLEKWLPACSPPPERETEAPSSVHPDPTPVDLALLTEITGGDPGILAQLAGDYLEQAEEILARIVLSIERRDARDVHLLAHKLGGSSSTCGMNSIVTPLVHLERMAKNAQLATALPLQREAAKQLLRIRGFLTAHLHALENPIS